MSQQNYKLKLLQLIKSLLVPSFNIGPLKSDYVHHRPIQTTGEIKLLSLYAKKLSHNCIISKSLCREAIVSAARVQSLGLKKLCYMECWVSLAGCSNL